MKRTRTEKTVPLNSQNLKLALWEAGQKVLRREVSADEGKAVAATYRELIKAVQLDLQVVRMAGLRPSGRMVNEAMHITAQ